MQRFQRLSGHKALAELFRAGLNRFCGLYASGSPKGGSESVFEMVKITRAGRRL